MGKWWCTIESQRFFSIVLEMGSIYVMYIFGDVRFYNLKFSIYIIPFPNY